MTTQLNFPSADQDVFIRGDDNAARTITIGQQGAFKDRVVIDSENFSVTTLGVGTLAGLWTFNAGLTSPTGSSSTGNEGIGAGALAAITSGFGNNAIGSNAGGSITDGGVNICYGLNAGLGIVSGDSNVCVGPNTMTRADVTECTGIGVSACREITAGPNIGIGFNACKGDNSAGGSGTNNLAIGNGAMQVFTTCLNNTAIGNDALRDSTTGGNNVGIGRQAGRDNTTGSGSIYIGTAAGRDNDGSDNIFIGNSVGNTETAASNTLRIHNAGGTAVPIIEGSMGTNDNRVGINTKTLTAKLNILVGATDAHDVFLFTQNDDSEAFGDFVATSSAGTTTPITSFTTGATVQGSIKVKVNGVVRWIEFTDNPTS